MEESSSEAGGRAVPGGAEQLCSLACPAASDPEPVPSRGEREERQTVVKPQNKCQALTVEERTRGEELTGWASSSTHS